ncbi:hypothetical protein [Mesorhizobium sp. 8]|uniref:hypothetical protein n=1 Tax=Mesorhizobium sp. 8 TaxID=2584466 RepID=UPI00112411C3|nr:hypothetical protein [Mesorhizobium sp. 8]QDB99518.1 hypothetical protein FGU64_03370 [Mesorhizobium sp. 8]
MASYRETDDDYRSVFLRWDHSEKKATRIIGCRDDLQFIIQYRAGPDRWRSRYFCRTRQALERLLPGMAEDIRAALPETFDTPAAQPAGTS